MRNLIFIFTLTLTACGLDVASGTATTAKLQAEQAKQAQKTIDKVQSDLQAIEKTQQERISEIDR